ncbi:MAG TPA: cytochrome C oxidase subunit IV family protein [Bacteroidota bacterium]|nr:cytochrome C oxidase subunit IV family protein [Bacteroidota bacterium]
MASPVQTHGESEAHGASNAKLVLIWCGLLALTGLTVALSGIDLGRWIILSALSIASVKTLLVVNVFMHLRYEDRVFRIFVLVATFTLVIFITLTFFDYAFH